MTWKPRQLKI